MSFPPNPTAQVCDLDFYEELVAFARKHHIWLLSDLAYAEIYFDGAPPPSVLQVPGAVECAIEYAVEFTSLSKTDSMPGWRPGFAVGYACLIAALKRIKSCLDYGAFTPVQVASAAALSRPHDCVEEIRRVYHSRCDVLIDAMRRVGRAWSRTNSVAGRRAPSAASSNAPTRSWPSTASFRRPGRGGAHHGMPMAADGKPRGPQSG